MKTIKKIICLALPLLLMFAGITGCAAHEHVYETAIIEPTCISIGYTINKCACGEEYYSDYQAVLSHKFSNWKTEQEATAVFGGEEFCTCENCGKVLTRNTECTSPLTRIYLTSGKEPDIYAMSYDGDKHRFACSANLSADYQSAEKPDFVISFLNDSENPYLIDLGWGQKNVYALKGYAQDATKVREETSAHFWNLICGSDAWISDGSYPIQLYINDIYAGLYMLSDPDGSTSIGKENFAAILQLDTSDECLFKAEPASLLHRAESDSGFLTVRNTYTQEEVSTSFSAFSQFVRESDDHEFTRNIDKYSDVEALLNAFLMSEIFYAGDAGENGLVWYSEDCRHWIPDFSTFELSLGLSFGGYPVGSEYRLPGTDGNGHFIYTGKNHLWERLVNCFPDKLTERYHAIRDSLVNPDSVCEYLTGIYSQIPNEIFSEESELFGLAVKAESIEETRQFIRERIQKLDDRIAVVPDDNAPSQP